MKSERDPGTVGTFAAFLAYFIWGLFPLYWPLLGRSGAVEILAHRIVWSALFGALLVAIFARQRWRQQLSSPRTLATLALASAIIAVNWGTYIFAVNNGEVTQAALGYYINPLFSILLGVVFLGERLNPVQWGAIGLTAIAVAVLTVDYGHLPWISLILATSFGLYGVIKKRIQVEPLVSLTAESTFTLIPFLGYLVWLGVQGRGTFAQISPGYDALLALSGVVTAVPLLLFAFAAPRIPLSTMGMMQYVAPTMQFIFALWVFHEPMSRARWIGFVLVWIALIIIMTDALLRAQRQRRSKL